MKKAILFIFAILILKSITPKPEPDPVVVDKYNLPIGGVAKELEIDPDLIEVSIREKKIETSESYLLGEFTITAYCPCVDCCGKWADGYTASNTKAIEGRTIAVDPEVIPLGSIIEINGAEYVAEDTGGFKGNYVDIFFNSHSDALAFGKKNIEVYLKEAVR